MATEAQLTANRANAQYSTGPGTAQARAHTSRNAVSFGLFSTKNCVQPHETEEYESVSNALWTDMRPHGSLQEMFAAEVVRAAWRLRRCVEVESGLAEKTTSDPMLDQDFLRIQTSVDRARTQAHGIMRRSLSELRRLQAEKEPDQSPTEIVAKPTQSEAPVKPQPEVRLQPYPIHLHEQCPDCLSEKANIPRSAACPCGSKQKYKRCCGKNAPAVLQRAA